MSLDGARAPGAPDGRPGQSIVPQSGHANGSAIVPVLQNGAAVPPPPTYSTHRLRLNPNSDHRPDSYEDLDLEFSPSIFSSLERYLPPNLLQQTRDVKVNYMREILLRYYPESERIRVTVLTLILLVALSVIASECFLHLHADSYFGNRTRGALIMCIKTTV